MKDTVIIGIGNILLQDDGVGVHVITKLENEVPPSTIELVDGGIYGWRYNTGALNG